MATRKSPPFRFIIPQDKKDEIWIDNVIIANPHNPQLHAVAKFLADSGADGTVIPRKVAEELELEIVAQAYITGVGGIKEVWPIYYAYLNVKGEGITIFVGGSPSDDYLLGMDAMRLLDFQLDIARRRILKPIRRVRFDKIVWLEGEPWKTLFSRRSSAK